jgi:hypothetical protein
MGGLGNPLCSTPWETTMDLWLQMLFAIILVGIAIELWYIRKAITSTNRLLGALLKHIKPD